MTEHTLERHYVATGALDHLSNHVVNEAVLVPDTLGLKLLAVSGLVDLLENVLEAAIVLLEDRVLGAHVQGQALGNGELERGVSEAADGLCCVVLGLSNAAALLEVEDLNLLGLATLRCEDHGQLAGAADDRVLGAVLVTEGVAADDDGLLPSLDKAGDAGDDDGFAENGAAEGVADGTVGGEPHCRTIVVSISCMTLNARMAPGTRIMWLMFAFSPTIFSPRDSGGGYVLFFNLNSSTRASSGVIVAHLTPTEYFLIASAASMVTWSLVSSRYSRPRS